MTMQTRIQLAKDFVSMHKNANIDDWQPLYIFGNSKYLAIYHNLIDGVYGNTGSDDEDRAVEISSHESKTGNSILFDID